MDIDTLLTSFLAGAGGGVLFNTIVSHFLERNRKNEELIFEARRIIYSQFLGTARNTLAEITHEREAKMRDIISQAILLAG